MNSKTSAETKKYKQDEIFKKRGGWRGGGRPKTTGQTTIAVRIDKKLENIVNLIKTEFKKGELTEAKIDELTNFIYFK